MLAEVSSIAKTGAKALSGPLKKVPKTELGLLTTKPDVDVETLTGNPTETVDQSGSLLASQVRVSSSSSLSTEEGTVGRPTTSRTRTPQVILLGSTPRRR